MKKPVSAPDDWKLRIATLSLAPGDTLVIQADRRLTNAEAYAMREQLETVKPPGVAVLLIDPSITLSKLEKAAA